MPDHRRTRPAASRTRTRSRPDPAVDPAPHRRADRQRSARSIPGRSVARLTDTHRRPMPDAPDAALDAHLDATHDDRTRVVQGVPAHPEHLGASRPTPTDCRRAAEWLVDALTEAGVEHAEVVETGGHPVVYARLAPRARMPRPSSSTATTTSSRSTRSTCGPRRRSSRSSSATGSSPAARPTTRARSTPT